MGNSINISKYLGSKVRGIEPPVVSGPPLFLDDYPGAGIAYSLRKQRVGYAGNVVRVRRASDNTELDIPFVGGNIDVATLNSFCTGTNGFVTTIYGQDLSLNNARQSVLLFQPKIYDSVGGVMTQNGKPAIYFDGVDDHLVIDTALPLTSHSIFDVVSVSGITVASPAMLKYGGSPSGPSFSEMLYGYGAISGTLTNETEFFVSLLAGQIYGYGDDTSPLNGQYLNSVVNVSNVSFTARRNNSLVALATATTGGFNSTREPDDLKYIGARNNGTLNFTGYMQEITVYPSDQTSIVNAATLDINTYYNVYP
jgi:hypothetical protein